MNIIFFRRRLLKKMQEEGNVKITDSESINSHTSVTSLINNNKVIDSQDRIEKACLDISKSEVTHENVQFCEDDDDSLIIEKGSCKNDIQVHEPETDSITNIGHFLREMHRTFDDHARGIECLFKDWVLINSSLWIFDTILF